MTTVEFPGAQAPARSYPVAVGGVQLAVHEWGAPSAPPLFLVHGGFDFARTFDEFAPRLSNAGWRVVSWDQRGHGDSDHTALYGWDADVRDAIGVISHISDRPAPVVGHSKGGALMVQLADAQPFRFSQMVNLDGLPSRRPMSDLAEHERTRMMASDISGWLDHRHTTATAQRRAGTLDELAKRRAKMNPRLSIDWLRYLVTAGAKHDKDGWRWKLDPSMRFGGFGPWLPEWTATRLPGLAMPFLGILGGQQEPMGWGTNSREIEPQLPADARLVVLDEVGHFVHIEQPAMVADMVLEFLEANR